MTQNLSQTNPSQSSEMKFSTDWVSDIETAWLKALRDLRGKENLRYLEIGVFEARSAIWFFQNVLTHPTSTMVGVDVFSHGTWDRCVANLKNEGVFERTNLISGRSQTVLKQMPDAAFDIVYVDGDHRCRHVFQDISLSWDILKVGGFMILDDYKLRVQNFPLDCRPQAAIDSFLTCFFSEIDVYHFCDRQLIVRKKSVQPYDFFVTQFGDYQVEWGQTGEKLMVKNVVTSQAIELTDAEQETLKKLLLSKSLDRYYPDRSVVSPDTLKALEAKLNHDLGKDILAPRELQSV